MAGFGASSPPALPWTDQMGILQFLHYLYVVEFDVEVLVDGLQHALDLDVVLELDGDFMVYQGLEEAIYGKWTPRNLSEPEAGTSTSELVEALSVTKKPPTIHLILFASPLGTNAIQEVYVPRKLQSMCIRKSISIAKFAVEISFTFDVVSANEDGSLFRRIGKWTQSFRNPSQPIRRAVEFLPYIGSRTMWGQVSKHDRTGTTSRPHYALVSLIAHCLGLNACIYERTIFQE
ncbi:hypothetical protein HYFRA_00006689 [Hymenoscyphus fraxineus]|uniref:Uncharacterized protein n=1 Tax=Hymenoscyphus fraxineus TaxID=746836 RepID=A0A9N9PTS1_9HELO|nr:hypothetical protein HYFRA_00006689 [Hymenoscyphus fraxineus]